VRRRSRGYVAVAAAAPATAPEMKDSRAEGRGLWREGLWRRVFVWR